MILTIYKRALTVLLKKPFRLWGISLLCSFLVMLGTSLCGVVPIIGIAISMLLNTAMTMIYLAGYRGEEVESKQLFACFKDWGTIKRILCGLGWKELWVLLWSLIPIVGIVFGLIRTFEYFLTPYILVLEPEVAPTDAIKVSKERTQGYKSKIFWANVLFPVLCMVVYVVLAVFSRIPYLGYLFMIVSFVFGLCVAAFSSLFLGLVNAAFYEEIRNPTYVAPVKVPKLETKGAFCPYCGNQVAFGAAFCSNCGAKLGERAPETGSDAPDDGPVQE